MNARRLLVLVAGASMGALMSGGSVGAATPSTSPTGGTVHVYDINSTTNGGPGTVVVTGAFADSGTDQQRVGAHTSRIVLSKGTFEVNTSGIYKAFSTAKPVMSPNNCGMELSATAPVTLSDGTGAYKGISGSVTLTITNAVVLPRNATGSCNESQSAVPEGEVTIDQGSGTVSFK